MDIKCRKTKCKYNKTYSCMAKKILVEENTRCATYELDDKKEIEDKNKKTDTSKNIFGKGIKNSSLKARKNIVIECKADCLFNKDGKCKANGITVNDLGEPCCVSYLKE